MEAAADHQEEGLKMAMMRKAEIDTSAPFRSVKEAVMLFGERVLAGEVYSSSKVRDREMQDGRSELNEESVGDTSIRGTIREELEETKQSLVRAREESMIMANSLSFLHQELERTKRELQEIKEGKSEKQEEEEELIMEILHEDLKFVEDNNNNNNIITINSTKEFDEREVEFQKKIRYVTFAEPPQPQPQPPLSSFSHVMAPPTTEDAILQRHPSLKRTKKKTFIPLMIIKGIFRKRGCSTEVAHPNKDIN